MSSNKISIQQIVPYLERHSEKLIMQELLWVCIQMGRVINRKNGDIVYGLGKNCLYFIKNPENVIFLTIFLVNTFAFLSK